MYADQIEKIKLVPMDRPKSPTMAFLGKRWNQYWGRNTTVHEDNVRVGRVMVGFTGVSLLAAMAFGCTNEDATPKDNTVAPCVAPNANTIKYVVEYGDTKDGILMNIAGVTYGTCMETAEDMTSSPNGGHLDTPREGDVFVMPSQLIPAAEAANG